MTDRENILEIFGKVGFKPIKQPYLTIGANSLLINPPDLLYTISPLLIHMTFDSSDNITGLHFHI